MKTLSIRIFLLAVALGLFACLISNAHAKQLLIPSLTQDPAELLVGQGAAEGHPLLYLYGVARRAPATVAEDAKPFPWWLKCESYSIQLQVFSPFKDQVLEGSSCEPFHPIGDETTNETCRFRCRIIAPEISEQPADSQRPVPMRPEQGPAHVQRPSPARPIQENNAPAVTYGADTLVVRSFYPMPDGIARVSVGFHLEDLLQKIAADADQDGVPDALDNCATVANFDQSPPDANRDGKPDVCGGLIRLPLQPGLSKVIGAAGTEQPGDATGDDASDRDGVVSGAGTSADSEQVLLKRDESTAGADAEGAESAAAGCSLILAPRP